jgi:uncharacterized protein (DUF433 family)
MHMQGENDLTIALRGSSTGGTGPDLTGFKHLTHAPGQWGDGVRIASNGVDVGQIAIDGKAAMSEIDELAEAEGITLDELFDALRYARANGAV